MLTNCRMPLLVVMLCLLDSGCISVRYGDCELPLEPMPAVRTIPCSSALELAPPLREAPPELEPSIACDAPPTLEAVPSAEPACLLAKSWHSRMHAALPGFWRVRREPPPVAPLIPPRSRFHPVPTRPVFARPVVFESVPPLMPPEVGDPLPEPIDTPSIDTPPSGEPLDAEAGQAPRPLSDELRVASPISPGAQAQSR